jgi:hypothetical protein
MLSVLYHLAWPGLGHFTRRGDGFHFEPEFMQMSRRTLPRSRESASLTVSTRPAAGSGPGCAKT